MQNLPQSPRAVRGKGGEMNKTLKCPYCGFIDDHCSFPDLFFKGCGYPLQKKLMDELRNKGYNFVTCGMCGEVIITKIEKTGE